MSQMTTIEVRAAGNRGQRRSARRRVLSFVVISLAIHALLLVLPMPQRHDAPVGPGEAPLVVEVVRELLPTPQQMRRAEPTPAAQPRQRLRSRVSVVGHDQTPRLEEGGTPGETPHHDAPAPRPTPSPVAHDDLSPERAALRFLAMAEQGETLQGRVDDMFTCARRSNGAVSCTGFSGGGWGRGGDDISRQGWGEPLSRSEALYTAVDLYCE